MNSGKEVTANSPIHMTMHLLSQEALRLTAELNNSYRTPEEIISIMSELTGKVFPKSGKVEHSKITFHNRYGITLAADMYMPILQYSHEIRSAVMAVHGEAAHSCYFGKDAFAKLTGGNKELVIIPNASHVDLYDRKDIIPFDKIQTFFEKNLK